MNPPFRLRTLVLSPVPRQCASTLAMAGVGFEPFRKVIRGGIRSYSTIYFFGSMVTTFTYCAKFLAV